MVLKAIWLISILFIIFIGALFLLIFILTITYKIQDYFRQISLKRKYNLLYKMRMEEMEEERKVEE